MDARVGLWRKLSAEELMLLNSWESLGLQGDPTSPFWRRSALGFLWREWCYSWNSSTLATSCKELTHWKRLWCWEGLGAGREGADRGWDGWMASLTWWTWVWVNSGRWWWTGRPGVMRFMGSQRDGRDWATELNWIDELESWRSLSGTHSCRVSYKANVNVMALTCYGSHVTVWLVKDPFPVSHVCWQHIVSWGLRDQDLHRPLWEVNRESLRVRQKLKSYVILITSTLRYSIS